jgi:septal ring factor EnvC (AmiA/AmiB activator)
MAKRSFDVVLTASAALLLVAAAPVRARGQGVDQSLTQALARRADQRLRALQKEADALAAQERTLLGDLRRLELDREMKAEALHKATAEYDGVSAELTAIESRIQRLEGEEQAERPGLRARLVEMYKLGQGRYLRLLLSTSDMRQIMQASRAVAVLAEQDRRRIEEHQKTIKALDAARTTLQARLDDATRLRDEARRAEVAAARAAAARDALIKDVDQRRDLNAQLTAELQASQQKLQRALGGLGSGDAAAAAPTALPLRPFQGDLPWPAEGAVRYRFGSTAGRRGAASNGIEIAAAEGASVRAVHEGVVAFAGPFAGFGNLVIIDHGGKAFSLYGNLQEMAVERGARVGRGDRVGTVGVSPAGPAGLYFELRVDGQPVDPLQWLGKR